MKIFEINTEMKFQKRLIKSQVLRCWIFYIYYFYYRWIAIAHPLEHNKITYKVQIGCVLFCYLQGLLWAGFPLFGWSSYDMEGILTSCSVQWQDRSTSVWTYNVLMFVFVLFVPVTAMFFSNFKLYLTVRFLSKFFNII